MSFITSIQSYILDDQVHNLNGIVVPDQSLPKNKSDNPDINASFGGKFSYLRFQTSSSASVRAIFMLKSGSKLDDKGSDMAAGAGGDYRYLVTDPSNNQVGIGKVAFWRLDNGDGARSLQDAIKAGYDGISNDFNEGRGGDYLYVVWKFV